MRGMTSYITSTGMRIPAITMRKMVQRVRADDDWQTIITEELIGLLPATDAGYDDAHEVLREAESRVGVEH